MRPPRWRLAVAGVVVALAAAGCGPVHPVVSRGTVADCYRAIPIAKKAIHDPKAKMKGVHRIPARKLRPQVTLAYGSVAPKTPVCVIAFQGDFAPGQVTDARPDAQGHYAIVVITSKNLRLVTSVVTDRLPRRFAGRLA